MNNRKTNSQIPLSLKSKLISAVSMLLIASIMMVTTTYAWLVMSTAPEVTGITTQVGANGSLEIVLLNTTTYNNLALISNGDIDEGSTIDPDVLLRNLEWGNLVSLADNSYGLDQMLLMPARLNIAKSADDYNIANTLLKTPKYGEDGRVIALNQTAVSAVYADGKFSTDGSQTYGVRAIGTASNQSEYQLALMAARNQIFKETSSARTAASNALQETGGPLGNIVVKYALGETSSYTKEDIQAMKDLAVGLHGSLEHIETALRAVFAAYIVSDGYTQPADWDYAAALAEINAAPLSDLCADSKYGNAGVTNLGSYINKYNGDNTKVTTAIEQCDSKINGEATSFTWEEIVAIMNPLVDYAKMTLNGKTISEVKKMKDDDMSQLVSLLTGGITITVPTGSGIISDIADFAGDYKAKVTVENVSYGSITNVNVDATMTTKTSQTPVYLVDCSNKMSSMKAANATSGNFITDFFGFVIDLAFKTNADDSNLLLQTEDENRIYAENNENPALMGGGSYMEYTIDGNLSATKMIKLMDAVRIVFMDKDQKVLCIAKLDTTLGQDAYHIFTAEEKEALKTDKYAALKFKVNGENDTMVESSYLYQRSDWITQTEYNTLHTNSNVEYSEEGEGNNIQRKLKAKLYLYNYHMTTAGSGEEEHQTGGLTIDDKRSDAVITSLVQDEAKIISALVYMDGSFVNNSLVAASAAYSMTGTLNLQFASSAMLYPADVPDLRNPQNP